ncbi:MAG: hypothetical protein RDV48_30505 [Candidatus Eremiobacteraeota bacterium]|nr:hypothetical protein [Candidatus Eremiobacteraeota bacterium]
MKTQNQTSCRKTLRIKPELTFIIVHLDMFNHFIETREDLREYFSSERLGEMSVRKFFIPEDNEVLEF